MVSADDRLPYFRPHVSKDYLAGAIDADSLPLSPPDWYAANDVEVLLDCEVTGLDVAARLATTTGTDPLHWDRCVLATGARPTVLPVPGADDPAVSCLRSASDAQALMAQLVGPVIVIGSGFVGCEAAMSLRQRGCDVTIVSEEARPQQDRLGAPVGRLIAGWLHDGGVRLLGHRQVSRIDRHGDVVTVIVPDAPPLEAAHVVVAVGATPNLQLAEALSLCDGNRLAVDPQMRTAAPGLFAIGDIATAWHAARRTTPAGRALGRRRSARPCRRATPRRRARGLDDTSRVLVDDRQRDDQARGVGRRPRRGRGAHLVGRRNLLVRPRRRRGRRADPRSRRRRRGRRGGRGEATRDAVGEVISPPLAESHYPGVAAGTGAHEKTWDERMLHRVGACRRCVRERFERTDGPHVRWPRDAVGVRSGVGQPGRRDVANRWRQRRERDAGSHRHHRR